MRLPIEPKSYDELKARFPEALVRVWDADYIGKFGKFGGQVDRPGLHPEHVFDTDDGLRLIISRDKHDDGLFLHVSCSMFDTRPWVSKVKFEMDIVGICLWAFKRIAGLEDKGTGVAETKVTGQGVVHLVFPLEAS